MAAIDDNISRVNTKLQQLLKHYYQLKNDNEKLREKLAIINAEKEELISGQERLRQQMMIMKLAAVQMTEKDKKEFEKQINHYIKEVEKCIGLLTG